MAWTHYQFFLAGLMVTTGSINTLSTKWADKLEAKGSDGKTRPFDHPFVQGVFMFAGEFLCLIFFKIVYHILKRRNDGSDQTNSLVKGNRSFNSFILLPPALCDMTATTTCYVGLNLTYASSFQMLRGSVIVFVGVFSVIFLRRRFFIRQWAGIFFIISGLGIVGASDFFSAEGSNTADTSNIILGDMLIVLAQIITAVQMCYEEAYLKDIPSLQAVGWEGAFGFSVLSMLLIPMYFIHVPPPFNNNAHGSIEDVVDAFSQILNNKLLIVAILGTVFSIAFFNFAGISVTKEISATTRMVLDSIRTIVIWNVSLLLGWQDFHPLQIFGFIFMTIGLCLYNNVIIPQLCSRLCNRPSQNEDNEPIISSVPADEAA